jgi:class 3 adenylate cyclase
MGRVETAERKLATVLFADLVGSTALGEHQDPARTRALLERFYDAMPTRSAAPAARSRSSRETRS